jgi:aldehyde dehydrogenase (NAD+)/aldehyde dehydrogenase
MFALNQGDSITYSSSWRYCWSFIERMQERLLKGNPLDPKQWLVLKFQKHNAKILNYINIGKEEGAIVLAVEKLVITRRSRWRILCSTNGIKGKTICVYSRRNFGPVVALTTFSSTEEYCNRKRYLWFRCGVWSRDAHELFQVPCYSSG